jgi:hypothetical protein
MFGHHHIPGHNKVVAPSHAFQRRLKPLPRRSGSQMGQPVKAAERQEMKIAGLLTPDQSPRHLLARILRDGRAG